MGRRWAGVGLIGGKRGTLWVAEVAYDGEGGPRLAKQLDDLGT